MVAEPIKALAPRGQLNTALYRTFQVDGGLTPRLNYPCAGLHAARDLVREGDRRREQWNCKGFDTVRGKNLKPHAMMGHLHRPRKRRMTGIDITALCDRGSGAGSWLAGLSSMTFYRN